MHAETLAYMFHQLPFERKHRGAAGRALQACRSARQCAIPAGRATLGLPRDSPSFGWDNEFEAHAVAVPEFAIDRYKVTNGEFLVSSKRAATPSARSGRMRLGVEECAGDCASRVLGAPGPRLVYRSMFDEIPLPLDWPVYVSHAEASAYARWAGKALPTEAQWHRAAERARGTRRIRSPDAMGPRARERLPRPAPRSASRA